jgi:hypothetical protein
VWVIDPPRTTDHRPNAQAQAQARTNKQNTRAISHQPSPIGRKPPHLHLFLFASEGSRQNPDTRDDNLLAPLHSQRTSIFSNILMLYTVDQRELCSQLLFLSCQQAATLPPHREKKSRKGLIYSFGLMQTALRAWNIPPSSSQPAAQHNQS